ncbi:MAG: hypothetical protein A3F17_02555 [Gammaproteobacteria bacterium RIFCSPHIGHO2_12_FULL_41_15]|nr:MAG: hypothetical protein A3F17_02555 [Gammaproteobacteria bacterium RIFCSPHIGHO2_12_FULL_41_15]
MNSIIIHGNAMVINNKGVLIIGPTGSGKSELCLKLLDRGHQLIADDAVEIKHSSTQTTLHCLPEIYKKIQIYELGLINLEKQYQAKQFRKSHTLDYAIRLNPEKKTHDNNNLLTPNWQIYSINNELTVSCLEISDCQQRDLSLLLPLL